MQKRIRVLRRVLAALIVLSVCLSALFVMTYASHDCVGDGCKICEQVQLCLNSLRLLAANAAAISLAVGTYAFLYLLCRQKPSCFSLTPVSLKVKLLN